MRVQRSHFLVYLIGFIFFWSGFAALLYQVVWQRMLGLFAGSDVISVTIITAAYLGGLGVGGLIGALYTDRLSNRRAVQIYGVCNLVIALFAFASRLLFYDVIYLRLNTLAESHVITLIIVFISLLFPTTLMGLSLPLIMRALINTLEGAAKFISRLYATNTLGAALGAFVSAWWLLGTYGYEISAYIGAAISLAVGVIALLVATAFDPTPAPINQTNEAALDLRNLPPIVWEWSFLVFVSGFIVISLEIVWFRVLDFSLKSNVYIFGHMLALYLLGDAVGSWLGAYYLPRIQHPRQVFFWIQGALVTYSLAILWLLTFLASSSDRILGAYILKSNGMINSGEIPAVDLIRVLGFVPMLVILPPAVLVGFYYPIVQKAIQNDVRVVGQRVSLVEVANIIGNTMGSIVTGVLLFSWVGTPGTLKILGVLGLLFLGVLFWENFATWSRRTRLLNTALLTGALMLTLLFPGVYRFWRLMHAVDQEALYFAVNEDSSGISAVRQTLPDDDQMTVWVNGRIQSGMPQGKWFLMTGLVPALIHPEPDEVLLIGMGGGGTAYGVGINPAIKHIDIVELAGSLVTVLRQLHVDYPENTSIHTIFEDPRYNIIVGDGRRELKVRDKDYDVIVVDAVLPWTSQAGLLYSEEFYAELKDHLNINGLVIQWRPTRRAEATFSRAFPYVVRISEIVMLGSMEPIPYDPQALYDLLQTPDYAAYLEAAHVEPTSYREWMLDDPYLTYTPDDPRPQAAVLTDLFPRDEYYINNTIGKIQYP